MIFRVNNIIATFICCYLIFFFNINNITLEASGKINRDNIYDIAKTGINLISSGWLTHSSPALDIGLDFE